jgi:hypothetical protein
MELTNDIHDSNIKILLLHSHYIPLNGHLENYSDYETSYRLCDIIINDFITNNKKKYIKYGSIYYDDLFTNRICIICISSSCSIKRHTYSYNIFPRNTDYNALYTDIIDKLNKLLTGDVEFYTNLLSNIGINVYVNQN